MVKKPSIISNYWELIDYNVHHIQHSELKASLIITAYGLIFGLAYDASGKFPIPENYKYFKVSSSIGKNPQVAPYSGAMLAIVALSANVRFFSPSP